MIRVLRILCETIWFRYHPITGPVAPDDPMPVCYMTWREAFSLARELVDL